MPILSPKVGDVIVFKGAGTLDWIISAVQAKFGQSFDGIVTHCALVTGPNQICEATILTGKDGVTRNGPQYNPLDWRLAQYNSGNQAAWVLRLADSVRGALNLTAMLAWANYQTTLCKYDVDQLVEALVAHITGGLANEFHPNTARLVCCQFVLGAFWNAGGQDPKAVVPWAEAAFGSTPEQVVEAPAWRSCTQVSGIKPITLTNFKPIGA